MPVLEALDYEKLIAEPYVHATYNYFDGEGKIVQQITEQASYSGKNIIQTFEYDYFGREAIKRLPYTYRVMLHIKTPISKINSNSTKQHQG